MTPSVRHLQQNTLLSDNQGQLSNKFTTTKDVATSHVFQFHTFSPHPPRGEPPPLHADASHAAFPFLPKRRNSGSVQPNSGEKAGEAGPMHSPSISGHPFGRHLHLRSMSCTSTLTFSRHRPLRLPTHGFSSECNGRTSLSPPTRLTGPPAPPFRRPARKVEGLTPFPLPFFLIPKHIHHIPSYPILPKRITGSPKKGSLYITLFPPILYRGYSSLTS